MVEAGEQIILLPGTTVHVASIYLFIISSTDRLVPVLLPGDGLYYTVKKPLFINKLTGVVID